MASARHRIAWLAAAVLGSACTARAAEQRELRAASVVLGRRPGEGRMLLATRGQWIRPGALWKYQLVYWQGRELVFRQGDERALVGIDGDEPQLASILVETPAHAAELDRLLAAGARGFAVVIRPSKFGLERLPVLPPGRDLAIAALYCHKLDAGALAVQTGVESLKLGDVSDGSDLSPLAAMTSLRHLTLYRSRRLKWSSLASLTQLEALTIDDCGNSCDLAAVAELPRLVSLCVGGGSGQPRNAEAIPGMTRLRRLSLPSWRGLADLARVAPLTRLEALEVTHSDVTDLSPLVGLQQLRWLSLSHSGRLKDLTPLLKLERLTALSLARCERISSLAALARMTGLRELDLSYNESFSDLSPLAGLTRLERNLEPLRPLIRAGTVIMVSRTLQAQLDRLRATDF